MVEPYHRFVYDPREGRLLCQFEEMYQAEQIEGFDSWHQDEVRIDKQLALALINSRKWKNVLDIGCGKGAVTARMIADRIVGIDVSQTALSTAAVRVPLGEFRRLPAERVTEIGEHFDLAVCLEVLSFIEEWQQFLDSVATVADWICVSLYLPPDPRWHVKNMDDLREELHALWTPVVEAQVNQIGVNGTQLLMLGRTA